MGLEELEEVKKVLDSGILTDPTVHGGVMVQRFEREFASFIGVKNAIAVNSGTAALHASLLAAGIKQGDEVILPPFTFVATANVVLLAGAKPVFVDIDAETYNIKPSLIKRKVTRKTRAILPVHLYGLPADMNPIIETAEEESITVIEDAAQAHGAQYKGRKTGSIGHLACFSFYPSKIMTTGEGGMITTNNGELAEKLRSIRTHGQLKGHDTTILGHNYRMPEIEAAIGYVQLKKIPSFLEARRRNARTLTEDLSHLQNVKLPYEPPGYVHCWYLYTLRLKQKTSCRDAVVGKLNEQGIGAASYYRSPVHLTPLYRRIFGYTRGSFLNAEAAADSVFQLPVHPDVTESDAAHIARTVNKVLAA